jgi:hypothetical protein
MEASSVGKCGYGSKGRWVKYWARLGCWISPCYSPFSIGARFETYEPFIYLIFNFFFRAVVNRGYWISGYGGTTVYLPNTAEGMYSNGYRTHLQSNCSSTWPTISGVQPLRGRMRIEATGKTLQHRCLTTTRFNTRPQSRELFDTIAGIVTPVNLYL